MEVNLTKRIETQTGSRYCPVVVNSSGRIKSDWVIVNGNQERHPEGNYVVDSRFFDSASLSLFVDFFRSFGGLTFDSGR
jgi:hypothetical protein